MVRSRPWRAALVALSLLAATGCSTTSSDDEVVAAATTSAVSSTAVPDSEVESSVTTEGEPEASTTERRAGNLTWYSSFPEPGSEECIDFSGCKHEGKFAALTEVQTEAWVAENNIIAVHEDHFDEFKLKTLRITQGDLEIEGIVYDKCADADCNGCCTANLGEERFLIDLELHTMHRFGSDHGPVEWTCLDC